MTRKKFAELELSLFVRISSLLSGYPVPITNVDYTIIVLDSLQSVVTRF